MARKSSGTKPQDSSVSALTDGNRTERGPETEETMPETSPAKGRAKSADEGTPSGNVSVSDVRKAVAFANSVGGLDKAIALLQILKVAKEVQG